MDWQEERARVLREARRVVVKVGSAVLTTPDGLNTAVMEDVVSQLAALRVAGAQRRRVVLVSSGAVAAGRAALGTARDTSGMAARQGAAAVGQSRLMRAYDAIFARHGIVSAQVLLTRDDLRSRDRFLNIRNTFAELLAWDVVPVVNENDTVSVRELKFGDNDCMASLLVNLVEADLFINLTSSEGVLSANPQREPGAPVLPCVESVEALDLEELCGGKTSVGTGGMYSKLLAARRAAQLGVPTLILPGKTAGILTRTLEACRVARSPDLPGTWVRPHQHPISRRKFWMAYQSDPAGALNVDAGAARALLEKGGSLLPGGVIGVSGVFPRGALVRVTCDGRSLGVGLTNYTAGQLRKIMGLKRHEVAAILGDAHYPEVIHRDNLLLDAAV